MFLPYGTDAPVYHYPVATIGIIVTNLALFLFTGMGDYGAYDWLILEFDRINPLQWVTSAFMHASWSHLIGNMIFLWCFGLIIEGKLGWQRFGLLYLGLALADGAIGQMPMFLLTDGRGGALGASGVIFALLAVALIWAPANDIHFFYAWSYFFCGTIEIPICVVAFFYFAIEFLQVTWTGISMSTPMLHLLGMSVGIPFAIFMLKHDLVDCEGWDLFSRLGIPSTKTGRGAKLKGSASVNESTRRSCLATNTASTTGAAPTTKFTTNRAFVGSGESSGAKRDPGTKRDTRAKRDPGAKAFESFSQALHANRIEDAIESFSRLRDHSCVAAVPDPSLVAYANLLSKNDRHVQRILPLRYLSSRPSKYSNSACLQLAILYLRHSDDPQAAAEVLRSMRLPLNERIASTRKKLLREANTRLLAQQAGEAERVG
ncbi:Membrane associated serine protease, rhomboid family [Neorhodopirellula lusitana]|uniref:Membrane associated serine protease, rhomboid family n=1 Tax=Neorhodopirellula lusitana TaxID=445327 RepID=A0ABY1QG76_9BACT|nr:rhomboid family intramembrane serine protease [Neorhodopirellula lusitana]SMP69662.1 Membrane associated serine protease, rhomboid family [Neorhodopirellula lusitana]